MCIAKPGRVKGVEGKKGTVEYFDGRVQRGVDMSAVKAERGDYVEVFGGLCLKILSKAEAARKEEVWAEVRRAAMA